MHLQEVTDEIRKEPGKAAPVLKLLDDSRGRLTEGITETSLEAENEALTDSEINREFNYLLNLLSENPDLLEEINTPNFAENFLAMYTAIKVASPDIQASLGGNSVRVTDKEFQPESLIKKFAAQYLENSPKLTERLATDEQFRFAFLKAYRLHRLKPLMQYVESRGGIHTIKGGLRGRVEQLFKGKFSKLVDKLENILKNQNAIEFKDVVIYGQTYSILIVREERALEGEGNYHIYVNSDHYPVSESHYSFAYLVHKKTGETRYIQGRIDEEEIPLQTILKKIK